MLWSEFKARVDAALVEVGKDDIEIFYIDTGNYPEHLEVFIGDDGLVV